MSEDHGLTVSEVTVLALADVVASGPWLVLARRDWSRGTRGSGAAAAQGRLGESAQQPRAAPSEQGAKPPSLCTINQETPDPAAHKLVRACIQSPVDTVEGYLFTRRL